MKVGTLQQKGWKYREAIARDFFDTDRVWEKLHDASKQGLGHVRLKQKAQLDLSETKAAKTLVDQLLRAGYSLYWFPRSSPSDQHPSGVYTEYLELVVSWDTALDAWIKRDAFKAETDSEAKKFFPIGRAVAKPIDQ